MKAMYIALFGIVIFATSCTMMSDFQPRHRTPHIPSVLPLVRIPKIPNLLFVNAFVNGRQGLFIVDTGANVTALDTSFTKELGLKEQSIDSWRTDSNVSGGLKVAQVHTLTAGNDIFEEFAVAVVDLAHLSKIGHHQIDGIIGMNILSITGCQIDPYHGQLSLHSFGSANHSVPILLESNEILMDTQFNGRTIRMKVDTGTNATCIDSNNWLTLAATNVVSTTITSLADVNDVTTNPRRTLRLECKLGDVIQKDFPVKDGGQDSLLGMDFFQHYVVTFDFKMQKAYIEQSRVSNPP